MDQALKERLIGAAVLVVLGVWLIPWVLDGRKEQVELDRPSSDLRLPAPDDPLPVRSQTLALDREGESPFASDAEPEAAANASAPESARAADAELRGSAVNAGETRAASAPAAEPTAAPPERAAAESKPAAEPPANERPRDTPAAPTAAEPSGERVAAGSSKPPAPAAPKPAAAKPSGAWAVQIGVFSTDDNAKRQAQRASVYGYKPEVSSYRTNGRTLYRVRVGSYETRGQAETTASSLAAHGVEARVVAAD